MKQYPSLVSQHSSVAFETSSVVQARTIRDNKLFLLLFCERDQSESVSVYVYLTVIKKSPLIYYCRNETHLLYVERNRRHQMLASNV